MTEKYIDRGHYPDKYYHPDKWVIIDYTTKTGQPDYSLMCGWYGGFAAGDSWRRSSPIVSVQYVEDVEIPHWIATTGSGAKYYLYKVTIGVSMLTSSLLEKANLTYYGEWEIVDNIFKEWGNV